MTIKELSVTLATWKLTRQRTINLCIGFSALLIYEFVARPIYRPYIYKNNINDFHLADTIGNSLGTIATVFILVGLLGKARSQNIFLIRIIIISITLYEVAHPLLGKPIDPWDVIATIVAGAFCIVVNNLINREQRPTS